LTIFEKIQELLTLEILFFHTFNSFRTTLSLSIYLSL
jgi:hypothetical protein